MEKGETVICTNAGGWKGQGTGCEKHPKLNQEVTIVARTDDGVLVLEEFKRCVKGSLKGYHERNFAKPTLSSRETKRLAHTVLRDRYANKLAWKDGILESDFKKKL